MLDANDPSGANANAQSSHALLLSIINAKGIKKTVLLKERTLAALKLACQQKYKAEPTQLLWGAAVVTDEIVAALPKGSTVRIK
jgi:hypothetical protein